MKVLKEKFIIIDGSSLMYRAFYALPLLETKKGQYTNAVYGFATMLFKLLENFSPEYIVVAFDKGKITFRNEIFDQYKAHRKESHRKIGQKGRSRLCAGFTLGDFSPITSAIRQF